MNKYLITGNILLSSAFLKFDTKEQFTSAIEQAVLMHISLKYKKYYTCFSDLTFTHHRNIVGNCISYQFYVYDTPSSAHLNNPQHLDKLTAKIQKDVAEYTEVKQFKDFGTPEKVKFSKIINAPPTRPNRTKLSCEIIESIPNINLPDDIPFVDLVGLGVETEDIEDIEATVESFITQQKKTKPVILPKIDIPYLKFNYIQVQHIKQLKESLSPPHNNDKL